MSTYMSNAVSSVPVAVPSASNEEGTSAESDKIASLDLTKFKCTDTGNAERLVALHSGEIAYCKGKDFLHYDGIKWGRDDSKRVEHLAKLTIRELACQVISKGSRLEAELKQAET